MNNKIKIFLDDERIPPDGWVLVSSPIQAIELLKNNDVDIISLDHDLGDDENIGTGYDVILWIEEQVFFKNYTPPSMLVHSANSSARIKMLAAIRAIEKSRTKTFQHNS